MDEHGLSSRDRSTARPGPLRPGSWLAGRRASAGMAWQGKLCLARLSPPAGSDRRRSFPRRQGNIGILLGEEKLHHLFRMLIVHLFRILIVLLVDAGTQHIS